MMKVPVMDPRKLLGFILRRRELVRRDLLDDLTMEEETEDASMGATWDWLMAEDPMLSLKCWDWVRLML